MLKYRIYNCHGASTLSGVPAMIESVKKYMGDAAEYGMNVFVMAKDWPIQASNVVTYKYFPQLREFVDMDLANEYIGAYKVLSDYAAGLKLQFFTSFTELYIPKPAYDKYPDWRSSRLESGRELQPDANPCFSHPFTKAHFQAKVREMCEIVPDADGFELWMGEKTNSVLYCMCEKCRDIPAHDRILSLINWAYETMKRYSPQKKLIVRSYLCAGRCFREPDVFLPIAGKLPKDIIFCVKGQYGDLNYLNDYQPLVGRMPAETVVEFDLGGEYRAFYYGYFSAITDYVERRMEHYLRLGASGFMFRHVNWLGGVNAAEAYAASMLCAGRDLSGREHEAGFLERRYGPEAAGPLCDLMRAGADICEKDLHILGCNAFGCFGILPETLQRLKYNVFDHCARMKSGAAERLLRCVDDPAEALEEKDRALEAADRFDGILGRLKGLIPTEDYEGLRLSAKVMRLFIPAHRLLTELLFAYMKYERTVYTDDRLRAIYLLKNIAGRLREWRAGGGAELEAVDLAKLRELQGLYPEVRMEFDRRNAHIDVDAVGKLCDEVEKTFSSDWEYYKWNIII
jgi:hypothetical protein